MPVKTAMKSAIGQGVDAEAPHLDDRSGRQVPTSARARAVSRLRGRPPRRNRPGRRGGRSRRDVARLS